MADSNVPFFLRLPHNARQRIYIELDLLLDPDLIPNYNVAGEWCFKKKIFYDEAESANFDDLFPNQLFYVSRAVSEDARSFFYGENVILYDNDPKNPSLPILMGLSPQVMRAFRTISIGYFIEYESSSGDTESGGLKENSSSRTDNEPFRDWLRACEWLATHIKNEDQLTLQLDCDARTKETAAAFLEPLHKLPRLKDLSIRLGSGWNPDIQQMIMTMIRQKTRLQLCRPPSPAPFRFFDLPVELQLHILDLSDLLTFDDFFMYIHCLNRFVSMSCLKTMGMDANNEDEIGHYCPAERTAFSTVTPCWRAPHILFLVSKTMRQLIIPVFYSRNKFQVLYRPDLSPPCAEWSVQKSTFLRSFPPYAFQFLRYIRWDFIQKDNLITFYPADQARHDWVKSLDYIAQAVPAGVLTVDLTLTKCFEQMANIESIDLNSFDWVVRPMTCLRGLLKDLFICINLDEEYQMDIVRAKEQSLEKSVMGDDYDSLARGKISFAQVEDLEDLED
ncbi:uncharacterized protein KD926_011488 [Aspergillus affinis]|uniref:uncharacterized protein n=1 Tax=Aspergillus affinis TaxID=1070780 RepID=UPI0022FE84B1|nr:uncharacterized protein KD926_011488 [Aspergillus affinis]KAI9037876.1 hypothetical protein KD926_011488 [Aspergillus affinis]